MTGRARSGQETEPTAGQETRRVAVIIPYFQREAGLLRRAVSSIAAQEFPWPVQVDLIVVDDQSPHPAEEELADFPSPDRPCPDWLDLRILRQRNGGPAVARNHGLSSVDSRSRFIAFLDSDDRWTSGHLATGIAALESGNDFYFCDSALQKGTMFDFLELFRSADLGTQVEKMCQDVYRFLPGMAGAAMTREYLCQTSCIVMRRSLLGNARFDESLRYAGEDWLLWIELAHKAQGVCFSTRPNSLRGVDGVALYQGSHNRLSASNLQRLMSMIRANELMAAVPGMDEGSIALCRHRRRRMQVEAAGILLHPSSLAAVTDGKTRRAIQQLHPALWRSLPTLWTGIMLRKLGLGNRLALGGRTP
ncbi:MAG: glycosyltransferase family A protein [Sphingobium sp.]